MLKWPHRETVDRAARDWAGRQAETRPELTQLGYFGSYARGDWGVGSDLDIIAVVKASQQPFERRGLSWNLRDLPVPAQIVVYTEEEWARLIKENTRFIQSLLKETVWIIEE